MEEDGERTRCSRQDGSAITINAASAAAVCAVGASAGQGGGHQRPRRRRCGCCLLGGLRGEEEEKKEKEKEGVADPRPIVTTLSVCDNWGVEHRRQNNSGLFLFFPLYLIGP